MKYRFIKEYQCLFPVKKMCRALKVSRGGYYAWLKRPLSKRAKENIILRERIQQIHDRYYGRYGSPRITEQLHDEGITVSRVKVARLMRQIGISAVGKKKFKVTTDSNHGYSIAPNLLNRNFSASEPGKVWVSDLTYISTREGWLYLTVIIDLFNRMIVGWSMSNSMRAADTTIKALKHAYNLNYPPAGLIVHSDRGVQFACTKFKELLTKYHMKQSMSAKGDCWDNAVAESFFGTLKKELVYRNDYKTRWEAQQSIFEYIEIFYNRIRKHSYLGNNPPAQFTEKKDAA
jgi:transposase InsO family protein